jgi:hypothetical protein
MWIKRVLSLIVLSFAVVSVSAATDNGTLLASGGTGGFDFVYPSVFAKSVPTTGMAPIKLQSRFTWAPTNAMNDHAIVAFVQGENFAYHNSQNQNTYLWTHGAGAFVDKNGLNLELWFKRPDSSNGSAYYWHAGARSSISVNTAPASIPLGDTYSSSGSYVEPLPANWYFVPGHHYWVRISLTPAAEGWLNLYAELYHDNFSSVTLVQRAQIGFQKSSFLPLGTTAKGTLARAPGSGANITWYGFDYF